MNPIINATSWVGVSQSYRFQRLCSWETYTGSSEDEGGDQFGLLLAFEVLGLGLG